MTGARTRVVQWAIANLSQRDSPHMLFRQMGFGTAVADFDTRRGAAPPGILTTADLPVITPTGPRPG